jgi:hypothetical protein
VQYGAQAGVFEGFGGSVSTGGTIYRSGATTTPTFIGVPGISIPGTTVPGTSTPGTPGRTETVGLGEVRFPTGVGDVGGASPPGVAAIASASQIVLNSPTSHAGGKVSAVSVVGEASPPWKRPRKGVTPDQENQSLSQRRADGVATELSARLPGVRINVSAIGSSEAQKAGLTSNDPAPERQRALMVANATIDATPGTTTPGGTTPGTQITPPIGATLPAGALPNPLAAGPQAWGWDTNVSVGGGGGAEASAAAYAGLTTGFAVPLGDPISMGGRTMKLIRVAVGLYKMVNDVLTGSPAALIRDAVALGVFGIEEVVGTSVTNAVLDWAVPMPAGAT